MWPRLLDYPNDPPVRAYETAGQEDQKASLTAAVHLSLSLSIHLRLSVCVCTGGGTQTADRGEGKEGSEAEGRQVVGGKEK